MYRISSQKLMRKKKAQSSSLLMEIHEIATATPALTVQRMAAQKPAAREPVTRAHTATNSGVVAAKIRKLQQWKGGARNPKMETKDIKKRRSLKNRIVP